MKITFYHSPLCPRCRHARKSLADILRRTANLEIEEVDVLAHPLQTWQDGIRLFPALKIEGKILSGIILRREKMESFIAESAPDVKHY